MPTLTRLVYVAAWTFLYVLAVFVLALLLFVGWWLFMIFVLHGLGCNGACNGIGRFSQDYALLIVFLLTVLAGLLLLPGYRRVYRRLLRSDSDFYRE